MSGITNPRVRGLSALFCMTSLIKHELFYEILPPKKKNNRKPSTYPLKEIFFHIRLNESASEKPNSVLRV